MEGSSVHNVKQLRGKYKLAAILKGKIRWPDKPEDRDLLYSWRSRSVPG